MLLKSLLLDLLLLLLLVGSALAFAIGGWLLVNPQAQTTFSRSLRDLFGHLLQPLRVERLFYRYHRPLGILIVISSLFTLFSVPTWFFDLDLVEMSRQHGWTDMWVLDLFVLFSAFGGLFTLAVGMLVMVRPSYLKPFEQWANRRLTAEMVLSLLGRVRMEFLRFVATNPRMMALLLMIGSLFVLEQFVVLLRHRFGW